MNENTFQIVLVGLTSIIAVSTGAMWFILSDIRERVMRLEDNEMYAGPERRSHPRH